MQTSRFHFCGCSIVNSKWAVTASHCVIGQNPSRLEILVGTNDLNKGGTRYNVSALYHHSQYDNPRFANDIALIRINGTIKFSTLVQPIEYSPKEVQSNSTLQLSMVLRRTIEIISGVFIIYFDLILSWMGSIVSRWQLTKCIASDYIVIDQLRTMQGNLW